MVRFPIFFFFLNVGEGFEDYRHRHVGLLMCEGQCSEMYDCAMITYHSQTLLCQKLGKGHHMRNSSYVINKEVKNTGCRPDRPCGEGESSRRNRRKACICLQNRDQPGVIKVTSLTKMSMIRDAFNKQRKLKSGTSDGRNKTINTGMRPNHRTTDKMNVRTNGLVNRSSDIQQIRLNSRTPGQMNITNNRGKTLHQRTLDKLNIRRNKKQETRQKKWARDKMNIESTLQVDNSSEDNMQMRLLSRLGGQVNLDNSTGAKLNQRTNEQRTVKKTTTQETRQKKRISEKISNTTQHQVNNTREYNKPGRLTSEIMKNTAKRRNTMQDRKKSDQMIVRMNKDDPQMRLKSMLKDLMDIRNDNYGGMRRKSYPSNQMTGFNRSENKTQPKQTSNTSNQMNINRRGNKRQRRQKSSTLKQRNINSYEYYEQLRQKIENMNLRGNENKKHNVVERRAGRQRFESNNKMGPNTRTMDQFTSRTRNQRRDENNREMVQMKSSMDQRNTMTNENGRHIKLKTRTKDQRNSRMDEYGRHNNLKTRSKDQMKIRTEEYDRQTNLNTRTKDTMYVKRKVYKSHNNPKPRRKMRPNSKTRFQMNVRRDKGQMSRPSTRNRMISRRNEEGISEGSNCGPMDYLLPICKVIGQNFFG